MYTLLLATPVEIQPEKSLSFAFLFHYKLYIQVNLVNFKIFCNLIIISIKFGNINNLLVELHSHPKTRHKIWPIFRILQKCTGSALPYHFLKIGKHFLTELKTIAAYKRISVYFLTDFDPNLGYLYTEDNENDLIGLKALHGYD